MGINFRLQGANFQLSPEVRFGSLADIWSELSEMSALPRSQLSGAVRDESRLAELASRRQARSCHELSRGLGGWIDANPCEKGGRLYNQSRRDKIWTREDELAFLERAPRHLHLALTLALWTGQRQADLLRLTWSAYDLKVTPATPATLQAFRQLERKPSALHGLPSDGGLKC
jgi:integrase